MLIKLLMTSLCFVAAGHASLAGMMHFHDPVSGDWDITLSVVGAQATGTMNLKVDGKTITGTFETAHTGAGTVTKGKWENGKVSLTAEFEKHESIIVTGTEKNGKLEGEFTSEGNIGKWVATKHADAAPAKNTNDKAVSGANSISGDWNGVLAGNGTTAPMVLKLVATGEKVTGTFSSEHMGTGTIEEGWFKDGKIGISLKLAKGSVQLNGVLADGKFSGDFGSGPMKGTWTATRK
ncbi:hypothetical protein BH10ACI2_BH10ACI2_11200 [soil metagenome]